MTDAFSPARPWREHPAAWPLGALAAILLVLALARPVDHDESQYVAAVLLAGRGLLPYRDFAYLQTPLQPLIFAPIAALAGGWTWLVLRLVNALLGVATVGFSYAAMRASGVSQRVAIACGALLASCDIFLFSVAVARNDALPAALFAAALLPIVRRANGRGSNGEIVVTGMLLALATAAKISYGLPAIAYGIYALFDRQRRPVLLILGALLPAFLVAMTWQKSPDGFVFGVFTFPARAPAQFYLDAGRAWKLSLWAKGLDVLKFLALGPALAAIVTLVRRRVTVDRAIGALLFGAALAALLPQPTWRQYLLPLLPPLFLLLARTWQVRAPETTERRLFSLFAVAGIAPSLLLLGSAIGSGLPMVTAMQDTHAIDRAIRENKVDGTVSSLSPQYLAGATALPDPRFATGPFYFRRDRLLPRDREQARILVSRRNLADLDALPPAAILIGGENARTSGDPKLDARMEAFAQHHHWRRVAVRNGHFRLYLRPR